MKKCVKVVFSAKIPETFLYNPVKESACSLNVEGTVQVITSEQKVYLFAFGNKEEVNEFLDMLYTALIKIGIEDIEIEPVVNKKDYRGIFRVITQG